MRGKKATRKTGGDQNIWPDFPGLLATFSPAAEPFSAEIVKKLEEYTKSLVKWNRAFNLVGSDDPRVILEDLILDSYYLAAFLDLLPMPENPRIWEPGAGAGIPGIPLRIMWRKGEYAMIERREKRALFLNIILTRLNLPSTRAHREDAQDFFAREIAWRRKADAIISRAFMPWRELLPFCLPALAPGGMVIVMANDAPPSLPQGWNMANSLPYLANKKERWLWAVQPDNVSGN